MDVLYPTIVVVAGIDGTSTKEEGKVFSRLVGATHSEAEVILTTLEVGVDAVTLISLCGHLLGLSHGSCLIHTLCDQCWSNVLGEASDHLAVDLGSIHTLKSTQSIVKLALAAATTDGEVGVHAPLFPIVGELEAGDDGCIGLAVEQTCCTGNLVAVLH